MSNPTSADYALLARDFDALRARFAGWPSVEQIVQVIDAAAFDLRREERAAWGCLARDASKRRRITLKKAEKIRAMFAGL